MPRTFSPPSVRAERERAQLRGDQLAVLAGISAVTLWRLETGARQPSINTVARLADALGVPLDAFLGEILAGEER